MSEEPQPTGAERYRAAAALGSKGGKSGTGDAKKRDSEHYTVTLAEARRRAREKRKKAA